MAKRPTPPPRPSRLTKQGSGNTSGGGRKTGGCCPMAAAVRSVKAGKFRLARRYAAMSVRLIAARAVA